MKICLNHNHFTIWIYLALYEFAMFHFTWLIFHGEATASTLSGDGFFYPSLVEEDGSSQIDEALKDAEEALEQGRFQEPWWAGGGVPNWFRSHFGQFVWDFQIWVCLKIEKTPFYPMVLLIRQSLWKMAISLGRLTLFSDKPICPTC